MTDLFTPEQATVLLNFLNRVEITGHVERNSMNFLCAKLSIVQTPPPNQEDTTDGEEIEQE